MKLNFRALSLIAIISVFGSCTNDNETLTIGTELNITACINPTTRADISTDGSGNFTSGDEILIKATNSHGQKSSWYSFSNDKWNAKEYDERILWYHLGNAAADFYAYYNDGDNQSIESSGNNYIFRGNKNSGNQAYDIMTAYSNIAWGADVSLRFSHAMSKLTVITTSTGVDLTNSVVSVENIYVDAATDTDTAYKLVGFGDKGNVRIASVTNTTTSSTGLFVPQKIEGIKIITSAGNTFEYKGEGQNGMDLNAGEHIVLSLNLIKGTVELSDCTIAPWNEYEVDGGNLEEALPVSTIVVGSSVDDSFAIGDIITIHNGGNNYKYTVSENESGNKVIASDSPMTPKNIIATNGKYEFTAYHEPASNSEGNQQKDMLSAYAYTENKYSALSLEFRHQTAKVVFNVTISDEISLNDGSSVVLNDLFTQGNWNILPSSIPTWEASAASTVSDVTLNTKTISNNSFSASGLVIAQELSKTTLTVADGGIFRDYIFEKDIKLEAGKATIISLTVYKGTVGISNVTVKEWESTEIDGGIIDNEPLIIETEGDMPENSSMTINNGTNSATYIYQNKKWTCSAPIMWGNLTPVNDKYNFTAKCTPLADQEGNRQKDLLSAFIPGVEKYGTLNINFIHVTANVEVELKLTDGVEWDHTVSYVKLNDIYTVGEWDDSNSNSAPKWVINPSFAVNNVTLLNTVYDNPAKETVVTANGLVIAQNISSITIFTKSGNNERTFNYSPSKAIEVKANHNNKLTLTLKRGEVVIGDNIIIAPWEDAGSDLGEIENN